MEYYLKKNHIIIKNKCLLYNEYSFRLCFLQVETTNEMAAVSDPPLMIRSEDSCDPDSLKTKPEVNSLCRCFHFFFFAIVQLRQDTTKQSRKQLTFEILALNNFKH